MPGDSVRRRIACKSAAASTHPRRTALCAAGRGRGTPWWANICGSPPPSTVGSARAALQLEQVVELGQHQQESQLLVGPAQAHRQPALRGLPLNQHQGTEARAVDLARAREVDDQAPGTRLNSSHGYISYAVFCLKKKKKIE